MAYVHFPENLEEGKDHRMWLGQLAKTLMEKYNSTDQREHVFTYQRDTLHRDPLRLRWNISCMCGWKKIIVVDASILTTGTPALHEAMTEHALYHTDPNHYTYYPQGV